LNRAAISRRLIPVAIARSMFGRCGCWQIVHRRPFAAALDILENPAALPVLVKMPALAVGRRHLDQPTLRHREHRIECGLHRIADIARFVLDDELRCGVAPQRIGVARKRDDARTIGKEFEGEFIDAESSAFSSEMIELALVDDFERFVA